MTEYRNLYEQLLKSGDLFEVLPEAVGDWDKDKKAFIKAQDELDYITNTQALLEDDEDLNYEEE